MVVSIIAIFQGCVVCCKAARAVVRILIMRDSGVGKGMALKNKVTTSFGTQRTVIGMYCALMLAEKTNDIEFHSNQFGGTEFSLRCGNRVGTYRSKCLTQKQDLLMQKSFSR